MAVECPAVRPIPGALPAMTEIPHFAATSKVGEFRAADDPAMRYKKRVPPFGSAASWSLLISSLYLLSLPGTLLTRAGGLLRF